MKPIVYVLAVLILGVLAGSQMQAGPLITVTTPGTGYSGAPFTLGFEFQSLTNVVVTALGTFDSGNGLSTSVPVGIWDTSGNLLDSATVPAGTAGTLVGYFRYTAIAPFALTAGTDYVIGSYYPGDSSSYNTGQGGSGSVDPEFVIVVDRWNEAGAFAYPNLTDNDTGGAWLGANLEYQSGVPEPSVLWMAGAGLLGLIAYGRRRK